MRIVDLIQKKRDNIELTNEEIGYFLDEVKNNRVPDYQLSSFLMAVYFRGMTDNELIEFTKKMRDSGDIIQFEKLNKYLVDKHSTGGVGDKVTVIVAPIISALGMSTTKLSGRGLGHTGGTIDKFESIKGFKFSKTKEEVQDIASKCGIGLMGSSDKIVPLDKKIYALRDVTATVASIPLIASSIMSKKLAVQSDVIILDVKVGDGAFMKDVESATKLAEAMIKIGKGVNRKTYAILSNMDQPLGYSIGNSVEIIEGIEALKGNISEDLFEVVSEIASLAILSRGEIKDKKIAKKMVKEVIDNGTALEKFKEFITYSGASSDICDNYDLLPKAKYQYDVISKKEGYVEKIKAEEIGHAAMIVGAGRRTKEDSLDYAAGIILAKKLSDHVEVGEKLATILYNNDEQLNESIANILDAYVISMHKVEKPKSIFKIIE